MKKHNVLIVESDPIWQSYLGQSLMEAPGLNFDITSADSAEEAFDIINTGAKYSVILIDYFLPGIKADMFIERFRTANDRTAIFCFIDNPSVRISVDLMKLGADDVYSKEELKNPGLLTKIVRSMLQKREYNSECARKKMKNERKEAMGNLLRTIEHELYNPATIIKLVSYRLKSRKMSSRSEYGEDLETLIRAIDRMVCAIHKFSNLLEEIPNGEIAGGKIYSM